MAERAAHAAVKLEKTTLKRQLEGLKTRFREVQSEANTTREALDGYRDTVQRVEFQKRLLCAQVLELEAKLSEREEERERVLRRERESLRRRGRQTRLRLRSIPGRARGQLGGSSHRELLPPEDRSHVEGTSRPLLHRSQFLLAFRGRETFYFEAEHRRLTWLRSSLAAEGWTPEESEGDLGGLSQFLAEGGFGRGYARANPTRGATASAPARFRAAERALQRERADLRRLARRLEKRNSTRSSRSGPSPCTPNVAKRGWSRRCGATRRARPRRTPNGSAPVLGWCRRRRGGRDPIAGGRRRRRRRFRGGGGGG